MTEKIIDNDEQIRKKVEELMEMMMIDGTKGRHDTFGDYSVWIEIKKWKKCKTCGHREEVDLK